MMTAGTGSSRIAGQPKCGDRVIGPRGAGTVVATANFSNASTVEYDQPHAFVIELNADLEIQP